MLQSGDMRPAVFLDRDGVINKAILKNGHPLSPRKLEQLEIIEGVKESIELFRKIGLVVVVVTNQPDLASGFVTQGQLLEMHKVISLSTGIDHFYFCGHNNTHKCACRKPKPGMLLKAASDLGLILENSFLVGDRWKDISAGQQVGCSCFFIDYDYKESKPSPPFNTVNSLLEAARLITGGKHGI